MVRGARGRYRPGLLLLSLSQNVAIAECLHEAAREIMTALAARLNVTAHLGILEGGMVTYVAKVCTPTSLSPHTRPGAQLEAYCSGLGKVLLAALPPEELDAIILDGDLVALTPQTITSRMQLRIELDRVRKRGYALDNCEIRPDMRCLAVPVQDSEGRIIAAMSATGHADCMTEDRQLDVRDALVAAARMLERRIFPPDPELGGARRRSGAIPAELPMHA